MILSKNKKINQILSVCSMLILMGAGLQVWYIAQMYMNSRYDLCRNSYSVEECDERRINYLQNWFRNIFSTALTEIVMVFIVMLNVFTFIGSFKYPLFFTTKLAKMLWGITLFLSLISLITGIASISQENDEQAILNNNQTILNTQISFVTGLKAKISFDPAYVSFKTKTLQQVLASLSSAGQVPSTINMTQVQQLITKILAYEKETNPTKTFYSVEELTIGLSILGVSKIKYGYVETVRENEQKYTSAGLALFILTFVLSFFATIHSIFLWKSSKEQYQQPSPASLPTDTVIQTPDRQAYEMEKQV